MDECNASANLPSTKTGAGERALVQKLVNVKINFYVKKHFVDELCYKYLLWKGYFIFKQYFCHVSLFCTNKFCPQKIDKSLLAALIKVLLRVPRPLFVLFIFDSQLVDFLNLAPVFLFLSLQEEKGVDLKTPNNGFRIYVIYCRWHGCNARQQAE